MSGDDNFKRLDADRDIESMFKVEPPFRDDPLIHGYSGVLLRDKKTDELQCHKCGEWHQGLSNHLRKHKMTATQYRKQYGLPAPLALVGRGTSAKHAKRARRPEMLAHLARVRKPGNRVSRKKRSLIMRDALSREAYLNKKGLCEAQMLKRYLVVADMIEGSPGQRDIVRHDEALFAAIIRRYGTINKFRKKHHLEEVPRARKWDEHSLIAAIRNRAHELGRLPKSSDFRRSIRGCPTEPTILRHFGSFRRALAVSLSPDMR